MSAEETARSADLKAWLLLHRVRDLAVYIQNRICSQYGLTVEQYTVLAAIKYFDAPVTVGDVVRWTGHARRAGMVTDRMSQLGLVERTRDLPDRRRIRLTVTRKGEEAIKQATPAVWDFVETTMSSLSEEEKNTLIELLEKVREGELRHYTPDDDSRISGGYETSDLSRLMKKLSRYAPPPPSNLNRPTPTARSNSHGAPRVQPAPGIVDRQGSHAQSSTDSGAVDSLAQIAYRVCIIFKGCGG